MRPCDGKRLWDHPRIRGTNLIYDNPISFTGGSSPHTRDKFNSKVFSGRIGGIIPAYAGQILFFRSWKFYIQDHPRIRGTNLLGRLRFPTRLGSSPHTRDKSLFWKIGEQILRIIPAYAGQIYQVLTLAGSSVGSSPHTRDKSEGTYLRQNL